MTSLYTLYYMTLIHAHHLTAEFSYSSTSASTLRLFYSHGIGLFSVWNVRRTTFTSATYWITQLSHIVISASATDGSILVLLSRHPAKLRTVLLISNAKSKLSVSSLRFLEKLTIGYFVAVQVMRLTVGTCWRSFYFINSSFGVP